VVKVFIHLDCTCGAQGQNYDLIAEKATKTSFWRSIIPGLEMLENTQHATLATSHPHNFATIAL